jgi:ribonucleoside-diphosphate reductase alpha chain
MERHFTQPGMHPFDALEWERRTASITSEKGETVFTQVDVEVPSSWSQLATNVVVSKYFRGLQGSPQRETSVRQMISRVADTTRDWAERGGYFASSEDLEVFHQELCAILVNQVAAFNSPVWFNLGADPNPQVSACFINSVEDTMASILTLAKTEGMLFKHGSGTGTNLSSIRSSVEHLASGGTASGPVSFMKGFDAFAGVIKSGGTTRRAAKMVILNADHPDIVDFINCKVREERKAWALIEAGYDGAFTGEAYSSVFFQNSNNSIRVTDEFMRAFLEDKEWRTYAVTDRSRVVGTFRARDLMRQIAEAAWSCGDPGLQFDTTINEWHTSPNSGRINASNPCSEFVYLDDTACNLSSINLMKFLSEDGSFDLEGYRHTIQVMLTAMEVLVGFATYPTERITQNSIKFRPLGLGYANLGAVLMALGLPYDSPQARDYSGALTAVLTGEAYAQSARIAKEVGPFEGYEVNRQPMLRVMEKHRAAAYKISSEHAPAPILAAARKAWDDAHELGAVHGYRNAQATVLAPTGTISFMLDCDTTGVEPDIALVKYKKLVGGGLLKMVNGTVPSALRKLGYGAEAISDIVAYINEQDTIEGAPHLREDDLAVFDCAFPPTASALSAGRVTCG